MNESTKFALAFDSTFVDATTSKGTGYFYRIAAEDVHGNMGASSIELNETSIDVELSSFTCSISSSDVLLQWRTETEKNSYGFEIERRVVSSQVSAISDWQKIGSVRAHGTSNAPNEYSFTDKNLLVGRYDYRLKQIDNSGSFKYSQSVEIEIIAPNNFTLFQNYPNPFNPSTTFSFDIPSNSFVSLKVFDQLGREVANIVSEELSAGSYSRQWNAANLSSGIYFYRLQAGSLSETKKLTMMK